MSNENYTIDVSSISEEDALLIQNQLERVLVSSYFKLAEQQKRFLRFIIEKSLEGQIKQLKQYTIAVEGLDFADNFDPDTNPVIRINAGRIRKKLEDYYASEGATDLLQISLPKGSYSPLFYKNFTGRQPIVKEGYSLPPKLAVLCFSDKTQNDESNRLLFHVTDTLATELSRFLFTKIVVSIPHGDKSETRFVASEIEDRFQADYMLIFYIQQLPKNQHLLLCRVLDVKTKEIIWSDTYDIEHNIAFHKQYKIIGSISAAASDIQQGALYQHWTRRLLEDETAIPSHYKALVYYRNYTDDLGYDTFKKGVVACQNYLQKNPNDVISNVVLADFCRRNYIYDFGFSNVSLKIGKQCALDAVRVKPDSHEAHYALGQIFFCLGEKERALSEFKIARDLCQYHAYIEFGIGFHLYFMGEKEEGLELVNKVLSLSSNYPSWFNVIPFCHYYLLKEYDTALSYALKVDAPILFSGAITRCMTYAQLGEKEKAQEELKDAVKNIPDLMENGEKMFLRFFGSKELANTFWSGILNVNK